MRRIDWKDLTRRAPGLLLAFCILILAGCGQTGQGTGGQAVSQATPEPTSTTSTAAGAGSGREFLPDAGSGTDYSRYTIRVYSSTTLDAALDVFSNPSGEARDRWLVNAAKAAGFTVSVEDYPAGGGAALAVANEKGDGDILLGLNEGLWSQVLDGVWENLSLMEWTPSWASAVGEYVLDGRAYGVSLRNVLMLYRTDGYGTNGEELRLQHWADITNSALTWYRQSGAVGEVNASVIAAILYPYVSPDSPAGGISTAGWQALWNYCANGVYTGDNYGFDPLNRGQVQVATDCSAALYGKIDAAADYASDPLLGTLDPENWALANISDGTFYTAEYLGILDKPGRSAAQTAAVEAFAQWLGGPEAQADWAVTFNTFPCNTLAVAEVYGSDIPEFYTLPNFALTPVAGGQIYAAYAAEHSTAWNHILNGLGFFRTVDSMPEPPDWDHLDWTALTGVG